MNRRTMLKSALAALVACAVPWRKKAELAGIDLTPLVEYHRDGAHIVLGGKSGVLYRWEPTIRRDGALVVGIESGTIISVSEADRVYMMDKSIVGADKFNA